MFWLSPLRGTPSQKKQNVSNAIRSRLVHFSHLNFYFLILFYFCTVLSNNKHQWIGGKRNGLVWVTGGVPSSPSFLLWMLKMPWRRPWRCLLFTLPPGLLYVGFSACMFGLYSFMPVVIKKTSATSVNLSLLTADLYSLFCGLFLFHYKVSWVSAPLWRWYFVGNNEHG